MWNIILSVVFRCIYFQDILRDVNSKVAEKERKQRLLEIYHRVDPKSTIMYNGRKFKKSDILSASRRLMFEGVGTLQQSRGRTLQVIMVVLSDIVIFLQENNQKYYFITPENKVCSNFFVRYFMKFFIHLWVYDKMFWFLTNRK